MVSAIEKFPVPVAMLVTLALALTLSLTQADVKCPTGHDPAMDEIFYYSEIVAMGKALKIHPVHDNKMAMGGDQMDSKTYTVEMEIYCIYKGDLQHRINISEAGVTADGCLNTTFTVNDSYIVFLNKDRHGRLTPAYKQTDGNQGPELDFLCDAKFEVPLGLSELPGDVSCSAGLPDGYEEEDCFRFTPTKVPPYKTGPVAVGDSGEVSDDDDNGVTSLGMSPLLLALLPLAILMVL